MTKKTRKEPEFKIVATFDGPCTCCGAKLGKPHKRPCGFVFERAVGISGQHALRQVGVTVIGETKKQFVPFPKCKCFRKAK